MSYYDQHEKWADICTISKKRKKKKRKKKETHKTREWTKTVAHNVVNKHRPENLTPNVFTYSEAEKKEVLGINADPYHKISLKKIWYAQSYELELCFSLQLTKVALLPPILLYKDEAKDFLGDI